MGEMDPSPTDLPLLTSRPSGHPSKRQTHLRERGHYSHGRPSLSTEYSHQLYGSKYDCCSHGRDDTQDDASNRRRVSAYTRRERARMEEGPRGRPEMFDSPYGTLVDPQPEQGTPEKSLCGPMSPVLSAGVVTSVSPTISRASSSQLSCRLQPKDNHCGAWEGHPKGVRRSHTSHITETSGNSSFQPSASVPHSAQSRPFVPRRPAFPKGSAEQGATQRYTSRRKEGESKPQNHPASSRSPSAPSNARPNTSNGSRRGSLSNIMVFIKHPFQYRDTYVDVWEQPIKKSAPNTFKPSNVHGTHPLLLEHKELAKARVAAASNASISWNESKTAGKFPNGEGYLDSSKHSVRHSRSTPSLGYGNGDGSWSSRSNIPNEMQSTRGRGSKLDLKSGIQQRLLYYSDMPMDSTSIFPPKPIFQDAPREHPGAGPGQTAQSGLLPRSPSFPVAVPSLAMLNAGTTSRHQKGSSRSKTISLVPGEGGGTLMGHTAGHTTADVALDWPHESHGSRRLPLITRSKSLPDIPEDYAVVESSVSAGRRGERVSMTDFQAPTGPSNHWQSRRHAPPVSGNQTGIERPAVSGNKMSASVRPPLIHPPVIGSLFMGRGANPASSAVEIHAGSLSHDSHYRGHGTTSDAAGPSRRPLGASLVTKLAAGAAEEARSCGHRSECRYPSPSLTSSAGPLARAWNALRSAIHWPNHGASSTCKAPHCQDHISSAPAKLSRSRARPGRKSTATGRGSKSRGHGSHPREMPLSATRLSRSPSVEVGGVHDPSGRTVGPGEPGHHPLRMARVEEPSEMTSNPHRDGADGERRDPSAKYGHERRRVRGLPTALDVPHLPKLVSFRSSLPHAPASASVHFLPYSGACAPNFSASASTSQGHTDTTTHLDRFQPHNAPYMRHEGKSEAHLPFVSSPPVVPSREITKMNRLNKLSVFPVGRQVERCGVFVDV